MTSKEKIETLNYIWFYEPSCQEDIDIREAIINELKQDLEVLEILKKAFLNNGVDVKPKCKKCFNLLELEPSEWLKFKNWLEGE